MILFLSAMLSLALLLVLVNALTIVTINGRASRLVTDQVAILIPMRNEAENVHASLASALGTTNIPRLTVTVLNDGSTDATGELLEHESDARLRTLAGVDLPDGWLGKPHACHQLSCSKEARQAKYLVFLDADTRLTPSAISAAIATMDRLKWDFISPHPRELAASPLTRLIQPLMQWSWLCSVPIRLGIWLRLPSMAIANGQFIIVQSSAYFAAGGHTLVQREVIEDLELARALIRKGYKGGVAIASDIAECLMYSTDNEMRMGYRKSLWRAFGSGAGALFAIALLASTQILPLALALSGYTVGWALFAVAALTHVLAAMKVKSSPVNTFAHPFAIAVLIYMIIDSLKAKRRGTLVWKDRTLL